DPQRGFHPEWGTAIYDFGRLEVANFLIASAAYWLDRFHIDGLRVDGVASMLYLDYSRRADEWSPNPDGSNDNRDAAAFIRRCNTLLYGDYPGTMTIAEESTAWGGVSAPADAGGLGFGFKWNMGWMNDTLEYMAEDPVHRRWHHHKMTFGLLYAWTENFVLPLSHDEVVYGKGSILGRMPGDGTVKLSGVWAGGSRSGQISVLDDDVSRPALRGLSLPCRAHQLRGLAVFPVPVEPADGRGDAGGSRHLGHIRDDPAVGPE